MVVAYQGRVQGGQIRLESDQVLPEGAEVIVVVVQPVPGEARVLTSRKLAESELVGLWADREDIEDSAAYARHLREQAQRRDHASS